MDSSTLRAVPDEVGGAAAALRDIVHECRAVSGSYREQVAVAALAFDGWRLGSALIALDERRSSEVDGVTATLATLADGLDGVAAADRSAERRAGLRLSTVQ
jgi:hypothetical protein